MNNLPSGLKKVVLISFYFFPCTLTPSQRISYWAKHLHKLGLYPIVITREWSENIKSHFDTKMPMGDKVRHVKHKHYEVYYLPFRPGILDRAYIKWGENKLRPLFLMTKVLDVLLAGFSLKFTSYSNFFPFLKELLYKEKVSNLLISGEPFYLFRIGYKVHQLFQVKWFADYRDDWSTSEVDRRKGAGALRKLIFKIESFYEKKWVGTADAVISVSENYTDRIATFLRKSGIVIENGFEETILDLPPQPLFENFTLVYSGTLYPSQQVMIILDALKLALQKGMPFNLVFLGTGFDVKEKRRIDKIVDPAIKPYVEITERMPRVDALIYLQRSHAVLGIAHGGLKGIPSSKLYEYIGLKKPVLLAPTDYDIMEKILREVGLGFFAVDSETCLKEIEKIRILYEKKGVDSKFKASDEQVLKYSRFVQMSKISALIGPTV